MNIATPTLFYLFIFFVVHGPLTVVVSPVAEHRLWTCRLSGHGSGPATPRHVGSSRTGARTRVPCIGRRTLNRCATREALAPSFGCKLSSQPALPLLNGRMIFALVLNCGWETGSSQALIGLEVPFP